MCHCLPRKVLKHAKTQHCLRLLIRNGIRQAVLLNDRYGDKWLSKQWHINATPVGHL